MARRLDGYAVVCTLEDGTQIGYGRFVGHGTERAYLRAHALAGVERVSIIPLYSPGTLRVDLASDDLAADLEVS